MAAAGMQSVGRAIAVLRLVAAAGEQGLRLSDVTSASGLHKASASRILNNLLDLDVLDRGSDRRYRVHASFREMLGVPISSTRLRIAASPALSRLVEVLGETAFLSARAGFEAVCLDRQVGWYPLQALSLDVGSRRPLGVGAGSLALLAWLPKGEIEESLRANHARLVRYPAFSDERLRALAEQSRQRGFTEIRDLVVRGMTGIGVPVHGPAGVVVGAISVAALSERLAGERRALALKALAEARTALEARLGSGAVDGIAEVSGTGKHGHTPLDPRRGRKTSWLNSRQSPEAA